MNESEKFESHPRSTYVMAQSDYIAYLDKEIFIIWARNSDLFVYNDRGDLIDTLRNPDIEDIDDVDYTASDYAESYYEAARKRAEKS